MVGGDARTQEPVRDRFWDRPTVFCFSSLHNKQKIINKSLNHVLIDGTPANQPASRSYLRPGFVYRAAFQVPLCVRRRYLSFAKLKPVDQSEAGAKQRQQQQWSNDVKTLREFPDPLPLRVHVRSTSQGVKHFHTRWWRRPREVLVLKTNILIVALIKLRPTSK